MTGFQGFLCKQQTPMFLLFKSQLCPMTSAQVTCLFEFLKLLQSIVIHATHFIRIVDDIHYPDLDEALKPPTNESNLPSQPLINRTTKPTVEVKQIDEPAEPQSQPIPLPRTNIPRTPSETIEDVAPVSRNVTVPQVDRNLKKGAMVKYLQDEENLIEKHLAITVERLKQEREWDRIRMERESSANSEIANHLQEREEQMIEMLKKMEIENKQQVISNLIMKICLT